MALSGNKIRKREIPAVDYSRSTKDPQSSQQSGRVVSFKKYSDVSKLMSAGALVVRKIVNKGQRISKTPNKVNREIVEKNGAESEDDIIEDNFYDEENNIAQLTTIKECDQEYNRQTGANSPVKAQPQQKVTLEKKPKLNESLTNRKILSSKTSARKAQPIKQKKSSQVQIVGCKQSSKSYKFGRSRKIVFRISVHNRPFFYL